MLISVYLKVSVHGVALLHRSNRAAPDGPVGDCLMCSRHRRGGSPGVSQVGRNCRGNPTTEGVAPRHGDGSVTFESYHQSANDKLFARIWRSSPPRASSGPASRKSSRPPRRQITKESASRDRFRDLGLPNRLETLLVRKRCSDDSRPMAAPDVRFPPQQVPAGVANSVRASDGVP